MHHLKIRSPLFFLYLHFTGVHSLTRFSHLAKINIFTRLPDPLKMEVLLAIAATVEVLHGVYRLAHLDLRLPNIAFQTYTDTTTAKRRFMVKLIDFDCSRSVDCRDDHAGTWPGQLMYRKGSSHGGDGWNSANQDWLQLAVLIMMALRPVRYVCRCV